MNDPAARRPVIELRDVAVALDGQAVLEGVDLAVSAGEIFGLVGADGAGKSTLLKLAVGQLACERGDITVLGRPAGSAGLRERIAYMPQGFGLYPDLSVHENLEFFADLHGLPRQQSRPRMDALLERTGLGPFRRRRAQDLSGGMMQKLALACALVTQPEVLFLDEPTTGVDPVSRRAFWELLEGVRAEGKAIVYATANMDEAERCDRVGFLDDGRLRRQGSPESLTNETGMALVRVTGASARRHRDAVRGLPGVEHVFPVGTWLHVWLDDASRADAFRDALSRELPRLRCEAVQATLQDAMLRMLAAENERAHRSPQGGP